MRGPFRYHLAQPARDRGPGGRIVRPPVLPRNAAGLRDRAIAAKARAVEEGDLRGARKIDLLLRFHGLKYGQVSRGGHIRAGAPKFLPPAAVQAAQFQSQLEGAMLLAKAKVPPWFRPGYRPALRVIMWGRLSRRFRSFLRSQHRQGRLPTYLPAAAYFAERVKFSKMVKSNGTLPTDDTTVNVLVGDNGELVAAPDQQLEMDAEQATVEAIDLAQSIAAEDEDEANVAQTLEQEGSGMLATEDRWYDDPTKLLLAATGAIAVLALIGGRR